MATSNSAGEVLFETMPKGRYAVTEVSAPEGYKIDNTVYYANIDENEFAGLTDADGNNITKVIINDIYTADIMLIKVNESDTSMRLPGSTYGLYRKTSEGTLEFIASDITDESGKIEFDGVLPNVEYEIKELKAPKGYYVSEKTISLKFIVDDGKIVLDPEFSNDGNGTVIFNEDGTITWLESEVMAKFLKVDENDKALAGAKLKIVNAKGETVVEWTSTNSAYELNGVLVCGETYKLVEVEAPSGYQIADPIEFSVKSNAKAGEEEQNMISITMKDIKENKTTNTEATTSAKTNTNVSTGDQSPIMMFVFSLLIAAAAICLIFIIKKKKEKS